LYYSAFPRIAQEKYVPQSVKFLRKKRKKQLTKRDTFATIAKHDFLAPTAPVVNFGIRRSGHMSICPKNKSSKARRDSRRANWKMSNPTLVKCSKCGALMVPHQVCKACGSYNKKQIVKVEE
jgi:large subunit ribosomal protein L32